MVKISPSFFFTDKVNISYALQSFNQFWKQTKTTFFKQEVVKVYISENAT